jgi:hypothetical protein
MDTTRHDSAESNKMEGWHESFSKFFNYLLIFAFVMLLWGALKTDMAKRGVFGKTAQQQAMYSNGNYQNQMNSINNTATVYMNR